MAVVQGDQIPITRSAPGAPHPLTFNRADTDFFERYPSGGMKSVLSPQGLKEERGYVCFRLLLGRPSHPAWVGVTDCPHDGFSRTK